MTTATSTHGATFQRPGRYGVTTPARPATRTAWPDTKLSPAAWTSPRNSMSEPIDVPGRWRLTAALTARSRTSLSTVTMSAATASRYLRNSRAATATIGPSTSAPSCWKGQTTGYSHPGRSLTARNVDSSKPGTAPSRTMSIPAPRTATPAMIAATSARRRAALPAATRMGCSLRPRADTALSPIADIALGTTVAIRVPSAVRAHAPAMDAAANHETSGDATPLESGTSTAPGRPARPVHRATGASLVAVICVAVTFCGIMVMHAVRSDVDPLHDVMSHYANGSRGPLMSIVFYAFGLSALALGFRLRTAIDRRGITRAFPVLLSLAGASLIAAGVFEVDRPLAPQTIQEVIHSNSAVAAFVMLIVAMLLFSLACWGDDRWWSVRWVSLGLAVTAALAAVGTQLAGRHRVLRGGAAGARGRRAGVVAAHRDARPPSVVQRSVTRAPFVRSSLPAIG